MSETILESRLIGELFVERGLVTSEQLEQALEIQAANGGRLGEILVGEFNVSRVELASVLAEQWAAVERSARSDTVDSRPARPEPVAAEVSSAETVRRPLGEIFVERGLATTEQLEAALEAQRERGGKLGEILVEQGVLTRLDLAGALADQWAGLQKLRPPEPKPVEPWQQAAPRAMVEVAVSPSPPGATPELASAVDTLEQRVRATEEAVAAERWRGELRSAMDAFTARVSALEARLDGVAAQDDRGALEAIRATVVELRGQLAEPQERLAVVEALLDDRITPQQLDERLESNVAALGARLDALADRLQEAGGVDEVRGAVQDLQRRLDEAPSVGEELRQGLGAVEARIDDLHERLTAVSEARSDTPLASDREAQQTQELTDRLDAVEQSLAALTVAEETGASAAVESVTARLEALAAEAARASDLDVLRSELASVRDAVESSSARADDVDALRTELSAVRELAESTPPVVEVEPVVGRLAELESRLDQVAASVTDDQLAARVGGLAKRLDVVAAAAARSDDIERLRSELAAVREMVSVPLADDPIVTGLSARLDGLDERLQGGASQAELSVLATDLRAQVSMLREQVDGALTAAKTTARSEDVDALRAELASVRDLASAATGDGPVVEELSERLEELGGRLEERVSLAELSSLARDLREQLATTSSRLEGVAVEQATRTAARIAELESRLEGAASSRGADLASAVESIVKRLDDLAADAARGEDVEALRSEVHALSDRAQRVDAEVAGLEPRLDELAATLAEAARVSDEARRIASGAAAGKAELDSRLEALASDAAREWDVEALRSQLEALEGVTAGEPASISARVDALQGELAAVTDRASTLEGDELVELTTGLDALRASLEERAGRHELRELADSLTEQIAGLDDRATRVELTALAGDLRAQLAQLSAQTAGMALSVESVRETGAAALREAVSALESRDAERDAALSGGYATLSGRIDAQAAETVSLQARLDEVHSAAADRDEWRGRVEAGIAHRLEELAERLETTSAAVSALRADADGQAGQMVELQAEIAVSLDQLGAALRGELAVFERRADAAERANAMSAAGVMDELTRISDRVVAAEAAATAAGQSLAADLERATGSLGWRLEQVERALGEANLPANATRLEAIEARLDDGAAIAEEHVRVTERALRKGLASLGERIVEAESAYSDAGNTLRRSIERLGFAIAEADVRIVERDDPVAARQHAEGAVEHVAFAPTEEGYRLVALDGPPPTVGGTVELNGRTLRCTRLGASPLPLDSRPCAYLEPIA